MNIRMNNVNHASTKLSPKITVVGVGGAGGNAVNNMITTNMVGVDFLVCNTDAQAIGGNLADQKIQLGSSLTEGLGAGAKPEVGRAAAEETLDDVMQHLDHANMVFITAGMGGGTGTGAAPVIARACREKGILTVGVVTKPFHFEGSLRMRMAEEGISEMQHYVDTLIVIPNQNLFRVVNEKTTFADAFKMADSVLQSAVRGVTDLIVTPGQINLDFADIRSVMQEMGKAVMGVGESTGERRATEAAEKAISNPLLDDISMKGAKAVIVNVTGGYDMTLFEVDEACNRIRDEVDANANIIFGSSFDESMEGSIRVSVIATGIDAAVTEKKSQTSSQSKMVGGSTVDRIKLSAPMASAPVLPVAQPPEGYAAPVSRPSYVAPSYQPVSYPVQQTVRPAASASYAAAAATAPAYVQPELPPVQQPVSYQAQAYAPAPVQQPVQPQSYQSFVEQPSDSAFRGQRIQGAFIPPQPVESGRDRNESWAAPTATSFAPQAEIQQAPIQTQAPEKKKSGSLFERITSGIRREIAAARDYDDAMDQVAEAPQYEAPRADMRAAPRRAPDMPAQGRLNIDSPSGPSSGDPELEIPAFLRRQAN
ncbi:MAG: cell division protein FtsZ [Micavibrio aeruginosavorus]|uniref:Cell division protein FtsZ n=1 Tax=Micavibrio aeruginosavorus TaxID=349221 RepID=A0A2W5FQG1_9BACT|nr:MAG: cell division protein FtsZ [Micavibrio aeruginosavorus]